MLRIEIWRTLREFIKGIWSSLVFKEVVIEGDLQKWSAEGIHWDLSLNRINWGLSVNGLNEERPFAQRGECKCKSSVYWLIENEKKSGMKSSQR